MKIAILTAFRNMPESYSLVNDVRDQIKTLNKYGHKVVFFAQEGCKGEGIECEMKAIFPRFRMEKNVENPEIKKQLIEIFKKELKEFDVAIEHDLIYLQAYYTYRKAIMECGVSNVKWIHWAHSAISGGLNLKMPRSRYVYMNYTDVPRFAKAIGVSESDVRVVFNNKDPRLFFDWHPITYQLADKYDLFNRDIIQTYPICSTRMDAKGIDKVIEVFAKLKEIGNKVLLIICNANARRLKEQIEAKLKFAYEKGLSKDEIVFTSTLSPETIGGVPRDVVRDLMQISNLFIFPTTSEVCSNVLLEASMTKQLLVLNKDFPPLFDFGEENKSVLAHSFGSVRKLSFTSVTDDAYLKLAKKIDEYLKNSKINQQFLRIKNSCNIDIIYKKQLEPILLEDY
ncbi:MAG: glycosyltransferase family 4 protein [Candidatus Hodarchaeales archaeon]